MEVSGGVSLATVSGMFVDVTEEMGTLTKQGPSRSNLSDDRMEDWRLNYRCSGKCGGGCGRCVRGTLPMAAGAAIR